jgi:hypothetical protein
MCRPTTTMRWHWKGHLYFGFLLETVRWLFSFDYDNDRLMLAVVAFSSENCLGPSQQLIVYKLSSPSLHTHTDTHTASRQPVAVANPYVSPRVPHRL